MPGETRAELFEEAGLFVGYDPVTDVASQGESREDALSNLTEAIEIHLDEGVEDEPPGTDEISVPETPWF